MNMNGNRFKKIVYQYDLISGKVNSVSYQPGWADQFYHKYAYDAENRLIEVQTSSDNVIWSKMPPTSITSMARLPAQCWAT
jgi:hypothetical protein